MHFNLIAEATVSDAKIAFLMAVATIVGGAITWAFNAASSWRSTARKERKEDEKTIIDHLEALVERLTNENHELREEVAEVQAEQLKQRILVERLIGHSRHLESVLRGRRIAFEPFDPAGSGYEIPASPQPPGVPAQSSPPKGSKSDGP